MATKQQTYFKNTHTGKLYKVVSFDEATQKMILQGEFSTFTITFNRDEFKKWGYKPVVIEEDE